VYRQLLVSVGKGNFLQPYVIEYLLQFTAPVLGTKYAALGYGHITQTYIKSLAPLSAVADEADMRVLG
jgi:hypothetical protein